MALTFGKKEMQGRALHEQGLQGTHLNRFLRDPNDPLTGYAVFHGDDRQSLGEPLPTGSLRRSPNSSLGGTGVYHQFGGGPPASYKIRPTMSLQQLQKDSPSALPKTLSSSLGSKGLATTGYSFPNGTTFVSTSGLPPTQYKSWTSEYVDEYRGPKVRQQNLETLTLHHGTSNALRSSRYQFQGYPNHATNPAFRTLSPTSLTDRGQVMPNYETRVRAF